MRLSDARRRAGLTQEQAADASNLPVRTYQGLEGVRDGRPFNPTLMTLRAVAQTVGLSIGELTADPTPEELHLLEAVRSDRMARRAGRQ